MHLMVSVINEPTAMNTQALVLGQFAVLYQCTLKSSDDRFTAGSDRVPFKPRFGNLPNLPFE
jgi:hypothetical protein